MATKLFIIGNGFDIWSGINSQFSKFRQYYYDNQRRFVRELNLPSYGTNHSHLMTDLELVYGDPYNFFDLTESFWNEFETNLARISFANLTKFFDNTPKGSMELINTLFHAKLLLDYAFENWVSSLQLPEANDIYLFDDDCVFVNFNYTNTLVHTYGVNPNNVFHIHGSVNWKDSIIYGHSMHAYHPPESLKENGYTQLFLVGQARYQFDKHALQNYLRLLCYFDLAGVDLNNISDIYVLGHSFNLSDSFYFLLLSNAILDSQHNTNIYTIDKHLIDNYRSFIEEAEYLYDLAISHQRLYTDEESQMINMAAFEEIGSFSKEDLNKIAKQYVDELLKRYDFHGGDEPDGAMPRRFPKWHVSYYLEEEKAQFQRALLGLGWGKHKLEFFNDIGDCLADFVK